MREPAISELESYLQEIGDYKNIDALDKIISETKLEYKNPLSDLKVLLTHHFGEKDLPFRIHEMESTRLF